MESTPPSRVCTLLHVRTSNSVLQADTLIVTIMGLVVGKCLQPSFVGAQNTDLMDTYYQPRLSRASIINVHVRLGRFGNGYGNLKNMLT